MGKKMPKVPCPTCKEMIDKRGLKAHIAKCGSQGPTTAPEGYDESQFQCVTCTTPKAYNDTGEHVGTCKHWGDPGHLGHPLYDAVRAADRERRKLLVSDRILTYDSSR